MPCTRKGHVVGFLGDGINDGPALKAADVGISVDSAVDIAKDSADIILLEKSLAVLGDGVIEGRKVFGNITKYIKMGASSNFGNMFSVLGASVFLPFLPMTAGNWAGCAHPASPRGYRSRKFPCDSRDEAETDDHPTR